jgi:hypothetical protein
MYRRGIKGWGGMGEIKSKRKGRGGITAVIALLKKLRRKQ